MELKLRTAHSNAGAGIIVDEYGTLWKYSGSRGAEGRFLATTKGLNGKAIRGFYHNGNVFIVTLSDARMYFSVVSLENSREVCQL